jgi:serine/threonine-protein kinase
MKTLDQRADVWSLGVVLFNMLTGRTPYESIDALGELILAICSTASPSVRDYTPEVPIEVAEIVQRALQIAPTERFQDAGAMHDAIMAKLDGKKTISVDALADFPEPPPGSRRFIVSTPAGPAGTEVLPSTAEGKVDTSGKSDPAVSFGSVSMTIASPSTDPGATPAPTAPPGSNAPTSAQTASGGSPDAKKARLDATPGATTTDRGEPLAPVTAAAPAAPSSLKRGAIAAAAALSIGALAAWLVSGKPSSGANTTGATRETAATTGTATAAPVPSIAVEPVMSASPTPSEVPASTAQPSASAVEPATSTHPPSTGPVGRPTATGGTGTKPPGTATTGSAKPVDTSGFGDRK